MDDYIELSSNPKVADLFKAAPRQLTAELRLLELLLRDSLSSYGTVWKMILGQYGFAAFFAVVLLFTPETPVYLPVGCMGYGLLFHAGVLVFKYRFYGKIRFLVANGVIRTVRVLQNDINWHSQVNNTPQRIIRYELDGQECEFKTYVHVIADELAGATPVLMHPKLKYMIPLSFLANYSMRKR